MVFNYTYLSAVSLDVILLCRLEVALGGMHGRPRPAWRSLSSLWSHCPLMLLPLHAWCLHRWSPLGCSWALHLIKQAHPDSRAYICFKTGYDSHVWPWNIWSLVDFL